MPVNALEVFRERLRETLGRTRAVRVSEPVFDSMPVEQALSQRLNRPLSEIRQQWGFERLRGGQGEAVEQLLRGRDVLVVMPTGAGKSLIYQLASQCYPGLTVVVSPLIALMSDQLRSLARRGVAAVGLDSHHTPQENKAALERVVAGQARLLYLAPERLRQTSLIEALQKVKVSLFVVDEAHCITHWGRDFRPDYLSLAKSVQAFGRPPVIALTATATPRAQKEIVELLELREPFIKVTGFDRPNLRFACLPIACEHKAGVLLGMLKQWKGPALIYTGTRKSTEELSHKLRAEVRCPVLHYHAGLSPLERQKALHAFTTLPDLVMVATNAFGMGVDRPDLSLVLHHSLPGSLEAYYQEAGRGGRAGQDAAAIMLYDRSDRQLHDYFIRESCYTLNDYQSLWLRVTEGRYIPMQHYRVGMDQFEREGLVSHFQGRWVVHKDFVPALQLKLVKVSDEIRAARVAQLEQMIAYAECHTCRRQRLVSHFGQNLNGVRQPCCDNCPESKAWLKRWLT
jgi:ATP-dependent DNA helicase RecQ